MVINRLRAVLVVFSLIGGWGWADDTDRKNLQLRGIYFDREKEFPNLILPREWRRLSWEEILERPGGRDRLSEAVRLRNEMLNSLLKRVTVPVLDETTHQIVHPPYFYYMRREIRDIAPLAIVDPSGGVVRSVDGYQQQLIRNALLEHGTDPMVTARKIIQAGRDFNPVNPQFDLLIPGSEIRGVGSDFDLLVDVSHQTDASGRRLSPEAQAVLIRAIETRIRKITEDVEKHYELMKVDLEDGMKRSLVTIVDVKPKYSILSDDGRILVLGQIDRSVFGGGATCDLLHFRIDLDSRGDDPIRGELVAPDPERLRKSLPLMMEDVKDLDPTAKANLLALMLAQLEEFDLLVEKLAAALSPYIEGHPEYFEKQGMRAVRRLFENPTLYADAHSDELLLRDLTRIWETVKSRLNDSPPKQGADLFPPQGNQTGRKVIDQLLKTVRNGRDGMADNRLHRIHPDNKLEQTLKLIVDAVGEVEQLTGIKTSLIPPYADRFPLAADSARTVTGEHGLPDGVLMPMAVLLEGTAGGVIYHGTPDLNYMLSILRGSFRETTYREGIFRGTFTTREENFALRKAGARGAVIKLKVRGDRPLRIFNYAETMRRHPEWLDKVEGEAKIKGVETADLLAREYGIDLIVLDDGFQEILLKNTEAVDPISLRDIVNGFESTVRNPQAGIEQKINAYENHRRLFRLGVDMGVKGLHATQDFATFSAEIRRMIVDSNNYQAVVSLAYKLARLGKFDGAASETLAVEICEERTRLGKTTSNELTYIVSQFFPARLRQRLNSVHSETGRALRRLSHEALRRSFDYIEWDPVVDFPLLLSLAGMSAAEDSGPFWERLASQKIADPFEIKVAGGLAGRGEPIPDLAVDAYLAGSRVALSVSSLRAMLEHRRETWSDRQLGAALLRTLSAPARETPAAHAIFIPLVDRMSQTTLEQALGDYFETYHDDQSRTLEWLGELPVPQLSVEVARLIMTRNYEPAGRAAIAKLLKIPALDPAYLSALRDQLQSQLARERTYWRQPGESSLSASGPGVPSLARLFGREKGQVEAVLGISDVVKRAGVMHGTLNAIADTLVACESGLPLSDETLKMAAEFFNYPIPEFHEAAARILRSGAIAGELSSEVQEILLERSVKEIPSEVGWAIASRLPVDVVENDVVGLVTVAREATRDALTERLITKTTTPGGSYLYTLVLSKVLDGPIEISRQNQRRMSEAVIRRQMHMSEIVAAWNHRPQYPMDETAVALAGSTPSLLGSLLTQAEAFPEVRGRVLSTLESQIGVRPDSSNLVTCAAQLAARARHLISENF